MNIGIFVFETVDSMDPAVLAKKAEELGFESFWVPEHAILPVEYRKFKRPFPPTARAHLGAHPAPPEATSQPFSCPRGPRKRLAGRPPLAARSGSQA